MAKVIAPLMSAQARGKVGGLIFNVWRGINTVKGFKSPSQPRTARQLAVRAIISTLSRAWAALTSAQRTAWGTWADENTVNDWTGTPIRMSGENAYIKCNALLSDMAKTLISDPPAVAAPSSVAGLALTPGSGSISVAFTAAAGTDTTTDIWLQGPHSAGRQPSIVRAAHHSYNPGETTPVSISSLAAGVYTVFARHIDETTGLASPFVQATCTVS